MTSDPASTNRAEGSHQQIHQEHESIKGILQKISSTTDIKVLVPQLRELRNVLADHFRHEEAPGGLRDAVLGSQPHLDNRIDEILGEHRVFLDDIDDLLARSQEVLDVTLPNLLLDVTDLTRRLHDHEIRETEILTDAKYTDLGDMD
jgi:hypothetical protein